MEKLKQLPKLAQNLLNKFLENKKLMNFIFSVFFVIGFNCYFFEKNGFGNRSFFNFLLLVLCFVLLNKSNDFNNKDRKTPFIFAIVFALSVIIGKVIYKYNDISILFGKSVYGTKVLVYFFITLLGFTRVFEEAFYYVFNLIRKISNKESKPLWKLFKSKHFFLLVWLVIFLSWIPTFLAYYPGILTYDSGWQTEQAMGHTPYSKFHPPAHTFVWQLCLNAAKGTPIDPLSIYAITQMLFLSFAFAKLIKLLINKKSNNWVILASILFFTINPVIAVFSFNMTKDVFFTVFFVLFTVYAVELISKPEEFLKSKIKWISYILTVVLACLFRNNGIYVYTIFAVIMIFCMKKYFKKIIALLIIPIILYNAVDSIIYPELGVKPGNPAEALSVPIQQVARVVNIHDSELSQETKKTISTYLSYQSALYYYNPRHADWVKFTFDNEYYKKNKSDFYAVWLDLFTQYPLEYLSAFLSLNLPYWYIDSDTVDPYSRVQYIETGIYNNDEYTSQTESVLPDLLEKYSKVVTYEFTEGKPYIMNLYSITTPFWFMIFTTFVLIYKKKKINILMITPMLLLWLTHMAGPVSNFRYVFPLFSLYPLLLALVFCKSKQEKTEPVLEEAQSLSEVQAQQEENKEKNSQIIQEINEQNDSKE